MMRAHGGYSGILRAVLWIVVVIPSVAFAAEVAIDYDRERGLAISDRLNCTSKIIELNPRIHKRKYRLGVHAIRGFEAAHEEYDLTFSKYLTATAGRRFDPPIEFEMVPTTFQGLFDAVEAEEVDFFYANPGIYSCVGVERGAQPLATIVSRLEVRGTTYDLDVFGGVMFTQADNEEINGVLDLKDKIIGAGGISMIMAAQLQFYEMERAGLSYVMDPKQVVFTGNQFDVVNGVLSGDFDVGFVRTDQIERTMDADGNPVDPDAFKIIEPKIYVLDNGNLFPFLHSTDIYPEWPVAALDHVSADITEEVQEALIALSAHAKTGKFLEECRKEGVSDAFACAQERNSFARCDATEELGDLAFEASKVGNLAGFRTARSYFEVRTMHEAAGFIKKDVKGSWKCTRAETLYDGINCPAGHYKVSEEVFDNSCSDIGLACKEGYECFCKPCVKAFEVDVFQYFGPEDISSAQKGCEKMSLCGSVDQTKLITIRAVDNKEREDARVTAVMHLGQESTELGVRKVEDSPWTYEFDWSEDKLGVGILEVYIDGEQIPESPIRIQVVERQCTIDYPGAQKIASESGECVCGGSTVDFNGKCVSSTVLAAVISIAAFLVAAQLGYLYMRYKNKKADQMWRIDVDELHFDDPAEVIGQGSFGVVLLAEYRGTKVAIKRALRSGDKHGSKRSRSTGSGHKGHSRDVTNETSNHTTNDEPVYADVEAQHNNDHQHRGDSLSQSSMLGSSMEEMGQKSSGADGTESLGFLDEDYGKRSNWHRLFPWAERDNESRFKETILGGSVVSTNATLVNWLFPWCNEQARLQEEFVVEMRTLSRLRHPCITTVMGAVISSNHAPMLVMEYMEYGSLHDLLRNETMYLSGEIIMQVARDIASGLRFLHSSSPPLLHGDLKGRNILIDSRFRAKLCDFGLSKKKKNHVAGTPFWLAPEYLRKETKYNTRCDIYSVGIILFEIYSRRSPYHGENFRHVIRGVCNRRINKRPGIPATAPPKMVDLMKKCWSKDAGFRPQAKELDMTLMDMSPTDAEPLSTEQQSTRAEKQATGDMLYELFPRHIADALKAGKKVEPEQHEMVTVVFSDIVHFTDISRETTPLKVSHMLDRLYLAFDKIARKHQVFKVETIGDAYMGVTNLEGNQDGSHVKQVAEFAVDMISEAGKILIDDEDPSKGYIQIRVGFHSGPVVSNVIGSLNPRYGLFGDTVNTASRMESNSSCQRILCSKRSYKLLKEQAPGFPVTKGGTINVKGKGEMKVYWVGDERFGREEPVGDSKMVGFVSDDDE